MPKKQSENDMIKDITIANQKILSNNYMITNLLIFLLYIL